MITLILTCEHAVNTIPEEFCALFSDMSGVLDTHRAVDIGAKTVADYLSTHVSCHLYQCAFVSRLLVDCNRTAIHDRAFSEWSQTLSPEKKQHLLEQYYIPFRQPVIEEIDKLIEDKQIILHLSLHSFTPVLYGKTREAEIGLLYDPKRISEKNIAADIKNRLAHLTPHYRVRFNYPYLGISDGFTTALRKRYDSQHYIGLEIEMNQALMESPHSQQTLMKQLTEAISEMLTQLNVSA